MGLIVTVSAEQILGNFSVASIAVNVTSETGLIAQLMFTIAEVNSSEFKV